MIKVLVAGPFALIREAIVALLKAAPGFEVVGQSSSGPETLEMVRELKPRIVLMDPFSSFEMDGFATARFIRREARGTDVVILGILNSEKDVVAHAVASGAMGFIDKEMRAAELFSRIRQVVEGEVVFTKEALYAGLTQSSSLKLREPLTQREIEVFQGLAEGKDNRGIARDLKISENTVRSHVARILKKLNLERRTQVVFLAARGDVPVFSVDEH